MDNQDQRNLDEQIGSMIPEEEQLVTETSAENDFPTAEFSNPTQPDDDWDDEEEYLEDQTGRQMLYWIGGGLLILVLIALLFLIFSGGSGSSADLSGVNKEIQDIQARISKIEGSANAWNSGLDRLEATQQTTIDQINLLSAKVEELSRKVAAKPTARAAIPDLPTKLPTPAIKKSEPSPRSFHIVKPGDTLYSIHQKYQVSLDKLRKFNTLKEHEPIFKGQKMFLE